MQSRCCTDHDDCQSRMINRSGSTISATILHGAGVADALANVKERNLWLCHTCQNELSCRFAVACDPCVEWYDRVYNVQGCGMSQGAMCGSVATVTHEIVYL